MLSLLISLIMTLPVITNTPRHADAMPVMVPQSDDVATVVARMKERPLERAEGVWQFPADGSVIAIERMQSSPTDDARCYLVYVVSASNRLIRPGTVIGRAWPTVNRSTLRASLFTSASDDFTTLTVPRDFTLQMVDEESRLEIVSIRKGLKLNWWRMLPWMFRYVVREVDNSPRNLDGCVRIYPSPAIPHEPRYL